jgi:hypothetical protein
MTLRARQTLSQLKGLQRLAGSVIMYPLARDWNMQRRWKDNRDMRAVAAEFIKPNDRLTSFERIEIYNKQYWYRIFDSMYEDFPGLCAVLGRLKFNKLLWAYLAEFPSRSYSLRNLGSRLPQFIETHPRLVTPRFDMAIDMARFEWAQIVAFDGPANPPVAVDDLLGKDPRKLHLALQPYLTILNLRYPLDDFVLRLKKHGLRGEASNAMDETTAAKSLKKRRPMVPRPRQTFLVVHRHNNALYYKRLEPKAHRILTLLAAGKSLHQALAAADPDPALIKDWFETWTSLGWFCKPSRKFPSR